ncbi:MAG: SDR family NAD(P)-dependent oxidoreductase [Bacteroidales bacterium]
MEYVLITGGSKGIGRAISLALSAAGYNIIINYNSDLNSAKETKQLITQNGGIADLLQFDVSNYDQTREMINNWRKSNLSATISGLVCNAGIIKDNLFAIMPYDDWSKVINVNLFGVFNTIKAVLPHMIKSKYGRIINITSVAGLRGSFGQTNYSAAKAGVMALSKSLALEVSHKNITINCIAPGYIQTNMLNGLNKLDLVPKIPIKRIGEAEEIANAVLYFIDKKSAYTTGAVLSIDGGLSL